MATVVSPIILDETGQDIAQKLDAIREAVQPTNACLDIDISLPTSGWSGSGPYTYTYSNTHVTSGCSVKVNFLESNSSGGVLCLDYEKVTGGVRFTSSSVPNAAIPVRIHVLNADATSTMATTADLVSTDAISGTSNVQDALESVGQSIGTLNTHLTNYLNAVTQNLSYNYPTIDIISGTGTFRNYPTVGYNSDFVSITGVVRINSFSRTGSNPGVKITLPVNVKTVYKYDCVMTTAASTEFATIYASGNTVNVSISESVSNYNSTNMTIIFMNVILERS